MSKGIGVPMGKYKAAMWARMTPGDTFQTRRAITEHNSRTFGRGVRPARPDFETFSLPRATKSTACITLPAKKFGATSTIMPYWGLTKKQVFCRESLAVVKLEPEGTRVAFYESDSALVVLPSDPDGTESNLRWKWKAERLASIHMPTKAARSFGVIVRVGAEKLGEISIDDIRAELGRPDMEEDEARASWSNLWAEVNNESIAAAASTWVWCFEIEVA